MRRQCPPARSTRWRPARSSIRSSSSPSPGPLGAEQVGNTYPGYGPGLEGYGKRYAATMATATSSRMLGSAVFPALFHQDPRYFYQGSGGKRSRALHAIASTFVTRGDNGKDQPNFAHLLGSLSASAIANTYLPSSDRGAGVVFQSFGIDLVGNIAGDLFREFVLRGLVPSVPLFANGKRQASPSPRCPRPELCPSQAKALPRNDEFVARMGFSRGLLHAKVSFSARCADSRTK